MFFIRTNDQVKIAVYDLNPCGSETILLIHGWPLSHQIFEYQESLLTANGFRVVSMDLRGFGASDAPACGYGYDRMADDIYTVVRALNLRCFTLVGFSMGGGIVTRYMGRYNGYGVKRLVLLGAASPRFTQCSDFPYGVTREAVRPCTALRAIRQHAVRLPAKQRYRRLASHAVARRLRHRNHSNRLCAAR